MNDTKKVQTMVNVLAEEMQKCKEARDRVLAVRAAFQVVNPDVTGTPLEGNLTLVNTLVNDLDALMDSAIVDGIIAAYIPSHRGKALEF